jgi:hypothetical protein
VAKLRRYQGIRPAAAVCDKTLKFAAFEKLSARSFVIICTMSRTTTIWQELGVGVLAGATIVLASAIWVLLASEGGTLTHRIDPPSKSSPSSVSK